MPPDARQPVLAIFRRENPLRPADKSWEFPEYAARSW